MPFSREPTLDTRHQLVVTIGPASRGLARPLVQAGATAFRINASHLDPARLATTIEAVRRDSPEAAILVDLQGAKMRLADAPPRPVARDERVRFSADPGADVQVPHPELFAQVRPGETLSVDDGRVRFEVVVAEAGWLEARALGEGRLLPRKGVNVDQHPIALTELTGRDREACGVAAAGGVRDFAFSFMIDGSEAAWVREAVPGARVIGKVERAEATARMSDLLRAVDTAWICRGDLGAQIGPAGLARFAAAFDPRAAAVPVLMAGQVLEHLTEHPEPTRSEVCHLYDLLSRGYAGIVLSDETAVGRDPVHAVSMATSLLTAFRA